MANTTIQLKKSAIPGSSPAALANGELALNFADGKLFYKAANGTISAISSGAPSFGTVSANGTVLAAGIVNDVLTITPGENIGITPDYLNNQFTISSNIKSVYDTANAAFIKANTGGGGGASVNVGNTAPSLPSAGNLWWNTDLGRLFIYYTDTDSSQWVEATASGGSVNINSVVANVSPALNDLYNASFTQANTAFDKANSANVLAFNTGIGANGWANSVGTAGNNYSISIGASSNNWANTVSASVGASGNNWANTIAASIGGSGNNWANTVGTAGNNYANFVGASSNNWANTVGTAGNNYTNAVGAASNNWANTAFTTVANGVAAFAKANAALANTTGTFAGDLRITQNVVANTVNSMSGLIDLGPGSRPSYLEGRIFYDNVDKSLNVYNEESGFSVPLGQKEYVRVYNNTGTTLSKGKAVYSTGYHNTSHHHPVIALADASNAAKYDVLGLVAADIPDASHGYVLVRGWIGGIDTSNLTAGQRFHLGYTSAGSLVTVAPEYPNYPYDIGYCVVSDPTNGYLYVDRQTHTLESLRIINGARVGGDMFVEGDFTVLGTQTITTTSSLSVGTQYVYLSSGDSIPDANITFTGPGLDDMTFKGHYTGTGTTEFWVKITEANATGDYFSWSYNDFSTVQASNTLIQYQTNQLLANGISVYFQANTGHTIGSKWNASATAVSTDSGFVTNHTDPGRYTHAGLFRDATDGTFKFFNTYDAEPAGNIDIANNTFSLGNVEVRKITAEQIFAGATEIGSIATLSYTTANQAFDKANSANVLAFNTGAGANGWANTINTAIQTSFAAVNNYTISVGASANNWANTKLSNGSITLDGSLTTTGSLVANSNIFITPTSAGAQNEGGELDILGAGDYPDWTIDSYQNNLRIFSGNANTMLVQVFNSGGGTMAMDISGNLTVQGANVGYVAANAAIEFIIDGGGSAITTGQKGHLEIPFNCIIRQWTMLLDQTGSANVNIWKETYANFPPTEADTINAAGFVVTSAVKGQGSIFGNSTINAGDILAYNVATVATATRITMSLKVTKT